jgi:hypothetical protein
MAIQNMIEEPDVFPNHMIKVVVCTRVLFGLRSKLLRIFDLSDTFTSNGVASTYRMQPTYRARHLFFELH